MTDLPSTQIVARRDPPDPITQSQLYQGIVFKRFLAYVVDVIALGILLVVAWLVLGLLSLLTFGLLSPLMAAAMFLIPYAYHVLQIGGASAATLGMRMMGLQVHSLVDSPKPSFLQATILTLVFYGTVPITGFLILAVVFFNPYRRTLHDYLSGTIVLNRRPPPST